MKKVFSIIGIIMLSTLTSVLANVTINSNVVSYSNNKTAETTVDGALDELFSAVDINEEIEVIKEDISNLKDDSKLINKVYPIGSIYISTTNTNPSTILAGTTWERYGVGKTLLSTDGTSGQTGGSNNVTLSTNNLPSHTHSIPALSGTAASTGSGYSITHGSATRTTSTNGNHTHTSSVTVSSTMGLDTDWGENWVARALTASYYTVPTTGSAGDHTHTVTDYYATGISGVQAHTHAVSTTASTSGSVGSGTPISVQNPYITVYMWKRTA